MSRLNELVKELCPNGVEYKKLGEVCEIKTGKGITKNDTADNGAYPVVSGGAGFMGYYDNYNRRANTVTIARAGSAGLVQYIEQDFWVNDKCFTIIPNHVYASRIIPKYLFYVLKNMEDEIVALKSSGSVPTVNTAKLSGIAIPTPPLKIQQEIVKILDKFTELQAELQAELDLRLKQYEHYRDDLLSFDKLVTLGGVARRAKLLDIVDYEQPTKYLVETTEYDDSYAIPVLTAGKTFVLGYTNETDGIYNASTEDPVIIFDDFTTDSKWVDFPFKVKSSAMKMLKLNKSGRETALLRWIYLCMQRLHYVPADHSRHWISKYSNLEIPLPPLKVQKRLVNVLDNFESICADLNIGLPAEIKLRQQQYEYYRDELLSFKLTNV